MSGSIVEGQGGHSTHLSPSAGLSWSVETEPEAPGPLLVCEGGGALHLLPAKMAAAGAASSFLFLPLLLPTQQNSSRKGGAGMSGPEF